jgi:hypothetical protein
MRRCLSNGRYWYRSAVTEFESRGSECWMSSLLAADELVSLTQDDVTDQDWLQRGWKSCLWKSGKVVREKVDTGQTCGGCGSILKGISVCHF